MTNFSYLNNKVRGVIPLVYYVNRAGISSSVDPAFNIKRNGLYPYCNVHYVNEGTGIELISSMLGFCNASHFTRLLKKEEGVSPSEYRRQSMHFVTGGG